MINGKMFAALCFYDNNKESLITLKLEPMEGEFLRGQYEDIIPGYYMNKVHWNSVKVEGAVPDDLLKDMLDKSYQLILNAFSKKKQAEILGLCLICFSMQSSVNYRWLKDRESWIDCLARSVEE